MRRKHMASSVPLLTMCGYECTQGEYAKMRGRKAANVDCRHCLRALKKVVRCVKSRKATSATCVTTWG